MLIEMPDACSDIWANKHHYDFSDYPMDNQYHYDSNKKVITKFKDDCSSVPITEFIGLRPKMYSIEKSDLRSLQERKQMTHIQVVMRSHEHKMGILV